MANLFGSLLAGAVQGGTAANMKTLMDEAEEKRRLSFAKLQQQYQQENIGMQNDMAINRDTVNRTNNRLDKVEDRANDRLDAESLHKMKQSDEILNEEMRFKNQKALLGMRASMGSDRAPSLFSEKKQAIEESVRKGDMTTEQGVQALYNLKQSESEKEQQIPPVIQGKIAERVESQLEQEAAEYEHFYGDNFPGNITKQEFIKKRRRELTAEALMDYKAAINGGMQQNKTPLLEDSGTERDPVKEILDMVNKNKNRK